MELIIKRLSFAYIMKATTSGWISPRLSAFILAALLTIFFSFNRAQAQTWSPVGSGGMDDWVYASTVYNGDLIVGGKFSNAGGVSASHIARWDGTVWHALGLGVNGKVNALIVHNGLLYVGGEFTQAGGQVMNYIAIWDGTQWLNDLGDMGSIVTSFAIYNNQLIVGGYFTDADGVPLNYVARYGTTGWEALGTGTVGTQGQVMAMEVYNNELIVGGFFTAAGGVSANHVAKWNGTTWSALGSGISNIVYSFTNYNNQLIAGGLFLSAGGVSANHVAAWDGTAWSAMGSGMSGTFYQYVFALTVYNGNLIAGGYFTHSDGNLTNGIAQWNGTGWSDMGCGLFYPGNVFGVHTMCHFGTDLIVGGLFSSAGCTGAAHLASYSAAASGCSLDSAQITALEPIIFCPGDSVRLVASVATITDTIVLDQSQLNYNAGTSARTLAGYSHWQSFTAGQTGTMSRLELGFFNAINGYGTLKLFAGTGTGGTLLQTQTIHVVCASGNCLLPFNVSAPVVAGQVYSFQFIPGAGMPDPYGVQVQLPGTYAGGEMFLVDPSGTTATGFDMVFQTYVQSTDSISYQWSGGETNAAITVYESGTYTVTMTNTTGCTATADQTVSQQLIQAEILTNPGTVLSCMVDSILLTASPANLDYNWGNGMSDSSKSIFTTGTYNLTVTDPATACSASASATITSLPLPEVTLGNDTTVCIGCTVTLSAINGFTAYNWSTGETTPGITVDSAGTYFVQVTDSNGCSVSDTVIVMNLPLSASNLQETKDIRIYQNAHTGKIIIHSSAGTVNGQVSIYNLFGARVLESSCAGVSYELDVSTLPTATYFLELSTGGKEYRLKFIRN